MASFKNRLISKDFLDTNPNAIFVFGDNLLKTGYGGAALLRDHPQSIGFVTKKYPDNKDTSFYRPEEYESIFREQLNLLKEIIQSSQDKIFYISQLGAGLANKYLIWEKLIKINLENELSRFKNVVFCWDK